MSDLNINFSEYDEDFLHKSWQWLNDSEIKKLTLTGDFTREQQFAFYNSLPNRHDYKIWGVKDNDHKIGAIGLKKILNHEAEYFGYIGEKDYWNKGISKIMFEFILKQAQSLNIERIYLYVSKENKRAIKSYMKNNFVILKENSVDILEMERWLT